MRKTTAAILLMVGMVAGMAIEYGFANGAIHAAQRNADQAAGLENECKSMLTRYQPSE